MEWVIYLRGCALTYTVHTEFSCLCVHSGALLILTPLGKCPPWIVHTCTSKIIQISIIWFESTSAQNIHVCGILHTWTVLNAVTNRNDSVYKIPMTKFFSKRTFPTRPCHSLHEKTHSPPKQQWRPWALRVPRESGSARATCRSADAPQNTRAMNCQRSTLFESVALSIIWCRSMCTCIHALQTWYQYSTMLKKISHVSYIVPYPLGHLGNKGLG